MDHKRVIGEVAARHGIRLEEDDPAFVLVTIAEVALRDAQNEFIAAATKSIADQEAAVERIQIRLGETLAQSVRWALQDVQLPRSSCGGTIPVKSVVIGFAGALALFAAGLLLGGKYL
jgi:hypothetical protein